MATQPAEVQRLVTLVRAQFGLPDLVLHLTRLLAAGHSTTAEEAAAAGDWTVDELRAELARRPGADWDDDGRIVGFGLTLRPTLTGSPSTTKRSTRLAPATPSSSRSCSAGRA